MNSLSADNYRQPIHWSKVFGISDDKLRELIRAGEIAASDVRRPGAKRPVYLVAESAMKEFFKRRALPGVARSRCKSATRTLNR